MKRRSLLLFLAIATFCAPAALAAGPVKTLPGSCMAGTSDCVTAVGHSSVSLASTLTINEQRAISFGNVSVTCSGGCDGSASLDLATDGSRTVHPGTNDTIILLGGLAGAQSPGHYTVEGATEGGSTQVYISFADNGGVPVDFSGENYHPGSAITMTGPGGNFTMDKFVINESGNDVYGHYIDNRGGTNTPAPGISAPFDHSHTPQASDVDVVVGATLHTVAGQTYTPGKYIGTFNVSVSY